MKEVFVLSGCRTPIGSFGGSLKDVPAPELGAIAVREALKRANLRADQVDEVLFGCVLTSGLGQNVARQISLAAGVPVEIPACTIGMVCGSGMKAVVEAARAIRSEDADIVVAGGTENMSASPYVLPSARWGTRMFDGKLVDSMVTDGLWDRFYDYHMGITAENICDKYNITREEMDEFAFASQKKTARAQAEGRFDQEIVPVPIRRKKEELLFCKDEFPRNDTTLEGLGRLKPAFRKDGGRVTAGNASGVNDGAAALVLASEDAVRRLSLQPTARLVGWGQGGVDPAYMGLGPIPATRNALKAAGLSMDKIDLIEANEAFAAQSIAVARELGFDPARLNVNGGAISLGHPIGASGARIVVTLLYEMEKREQVHTGLATLCIGGGMGIAAIFEKI